MKNIKFNKSFKLLFLVLFLIAGAFQLLSAQDTLIANQTNILADSSMVTMTIESAEPSNELAESFVYENGKFIITKEGTVREIPAWFSIIPPLLAILMALIFREVISSLFVGIFSGALILQGFSPLSWVIAFVRSIDTYVVNSIADISHVSVILFSMLIGGMVAIISRNGGMKGVVDKLAPYAKTPVMGQFITWLLGVLIFFDDYANTLVVGNTMRPVTDKLKISREKLSYLVDSTAAPVAAIAFITTWIGAELGFIQQAIDAVNADTTTITLNESAYSVFLNSLQFSFYPILTLGFMLMLIFSKRDFGPMLKAERRARSTGRLTEGEELRGEAEVDDALKALEPIQGIQHNWLNALLPVLTLIIVVIIGLISTGYSAEVWAQTDISFARKLSETIGNADSYKALIWASASGVFMAMLLSIMNKIMSVARAFETLLDGLKTMVPAISVLVLAWSLGRVTEDLHTASFLSNILSDKISPYWIAEITFLLAAITAFSTGTSWGTMTILYPIVLPLAWNICHVAGLPEPEIFRIFYNVVSVVLAGAVFGDHCSPISDTTILSSMASSCPHVDHVRTQLPYAVVVAVVSMLVCTKLADYGMAWYITYPIGFLILFGVIRIFGKPVDTQLA